MRPFAGPDTSIIFTISQVRQGLPPTASDMMANVDLCGSRCYTKWTISLDYMVSFPAVGILTCKRLRFMLGALRPGEKVEKAT